MNQKRCPLRRTWPTSSTSETLRRTLADKLNLRKAFQCTALSSDSRREGHGLLEALHVVSRLLEGVHGRRDPLAVWHPLFVFLLVLRPVCRACPIRRQIEGFNFVDAVFHQTDLSEQVLA